MIRIYLFISLLLFPFSETRGANPHVLPRDLAEEFSTLYIEYKDRVCPIETYAQDFCVTLCDDASYRGRSSVEVLAGWIFYPDTWKTEPMIKVSGSHLKELLGTEESRVSLLQFANDKGEYKLANVLAEIRKDKSVADERKIVKANGKVSMINSLCTGSALKLFPIKDVHGEVIWYSSVDELPDGLDSGRWTFIRKSLDLLAEDITMGNYDDARKLIRSIRSYQEKEGAGSLPSPDDVRLEKAYNSLAACKALNVGCVVLAIVTILVFAFYRLRGKVMSRGMTVSIATVWVFITAYIILRTIGSHYFQFADGFEITLLFTSHIIVIFTAYSLFAYLALNSMMWICSKKKTVVKFPLMALVTSIILLALGIVIGSIWAKIAWGRYWGWDPKETWALITFIIYTLLFLCVRMRLFKKESIYHVLAIVSFLSVIMTYYGVNTFLPGLHSYA